MNGLPDDVREGLERRYGRYACLYFAAAVSRASGLPVGIMDAPQAGTLGHAFLVLEDHGRSDRTVAADATGIRTVGMIREDFRWTHGRLAWRRSTELPGPGQDGFEPDSVLVAIAARLPWLAGPMGLPDPGPAAEDELRLLLAAIRKAFRASRHEDWSEAEEIVRSLGAGYPAPR